MGDKTEDPTPKRLRESKKKGQIAKSQDLTTAVLFITAFGVLLATGDDLSESLKQYMKEYFTLAIKPGLTAAEYENLGVDSIMFLLKVIAPLLGSVFVMSLLISYAQVGSLFTFEPMTPKFEKMNPLPKIKSWFSVKSLFELAKSIIKLGIVGFLAYQVTRDSIRPLVLSVGGHIGNLSGFLADMVQTFTIRVAIVFIVIAAGDYFFQKKQHMNQMKMSKDEVKREYKEEEGDPHYKGKRKQMHQELAMNGMMRNVKKANVVVVNPTRIAVALYYERSRGGAPQIIAKGERLIADKIRELAKEYNIPIMRNVSLAQALNHVEIGDDIPEQLYEAVAEVLNFVYRLGQQERRR